MDGNHQQLATRYDRRWARLVARVVSPSLDRQLAEGRSPESGRLLAVRAQMLVAPIMRQVLAQNWEGLLVKARWPPVPRDPCVPFNREGIVACEPAVKEMVEALVTPLPIPVRGAAMASRLLSDGTGPLYDHRRSADLGPALRETITRLDPSTALALPG